MRIKSYFAPSVQAAIALAHKEFGHGVTLITSHVTSLENRHLGDYEVVFAIEEEGEAAAPEMEAAAAAAPVTEPSVSESVPATPPAPPALFQEVLQQAILAPVPMHQDLPAKLEQIRTSLVELGLDASLVRAFMTMLEAVVPAVPATHQLPAPDFPPLPEAVLIVEQEPPPPPPAPVRPASEPAPVPFLSLFAAPSPQSPQTRFSAAELAFMSSVSSPSKEQKA
jgi:hypothetical protein